MRIAPTAAAVVTAALLASCSAAPPTTPPATTSAPASTSAPVTAPPASTTPTPPATPSAATTLPAPTPAVVATVRPPQGTGTVIADGLEHPWSLVFVGDVPLFSQRGRATISTVASGKVTDLIRVPGVAPEGEGGLLGLAWSKEVPDKLFAYLTTADDNRVVTLNLQRDGGGISISEPAEPVITGIPKGRIHNGGRLAFGPDGMLYIGTGEAGDKPLSQAPDSLGGKILRISPSGAIPEDNPSGTAVWSSGHRNVQGMAWDGEGRMWASELGQDTWDELNLVQPGKNYGWPEVEGVAEGGEFVNPVATWAPADASPSGLLHREGTLYLASLRGQRLWVLPADPERAQAEATATLSGDDGLGRLRDVVAAPDGTIWVLTTNGDDDRIVSLGFS